MSQSYLGPIPSGASLTPRALLTFEHRLAESELFSDASLERLLDGYPRTSLHVTTMGESFEEGGWRTGEVTDISGAELLDAVKNGHLWLNVKELHRHDEGLRRLLDDLYAEIGRAWQTAVPRWCAGTLLISSPRAFVHYHSDSVPNLLWQIRGRKRVLVYPVQDVELAPPECLERICAGESDEGLPYTAHFDQRAEVVELSPGQAIAWPQNSPHRVENIEGVNVSLSTEHLTPTARRRVDVLRANRILRRRLGVKAPSTELGGLRAAAKRMLANSERVWQKIRRRPPISFEIPATFRVAPEAPGGFVDQPLDACSRDAESRTAITQGDDAEDA